MDYLRLVSQGAGILTLQDFEQVIREVIEWLVEKKLVPKDNVEEAHEVLEDMINVHVATAGFDDIRKDIVEKARTSANPDWACLSALREAVYRGVNRRRFPDYRKRIYRQVKEQVRVLERKGILQSQTRRKRLKKIGLKCWGPLWLQRCPQMDLETAVSYLPLIPCYRVQNDTEKEPKIFRYSVLEFFMLKLCAYYGAALTMSAITEAVEHKLSPPLYRFGKHKNWPEDPDDDDAGIYYRSRDLIACAESSCEEEVLTVDVREKLKKDLTPDELQIFEGLEEEKSKRELAKLCNCAPGTLENRRKALERKAARHDPCVRARLKYLKGGGAR